MNGPGKSASEMTPEQKRELLKRLLKQRASRSETRFPLSFGQRALWFLHQLSPATAAYNLIFAWRVKCELDVPALDRALARIIARHPSLTTTYKMDGGQPLQFVQQNQEVHLELIDASSWSEDCLRAAASDDAHRPFDLERGPLLRLALYKRTEVEHILLLVVHHIAVDFTSVVIFMNELLVCYSAERLGVVVELPTPKALFSDFVKQQIEMIEGQVGARQLEYWRQRLQGRARCLKLPADKPRPPVRSNRGSSLMFDVAADLTESLRSIARAEGTTLYTVLLASLHVLLHYITGQQDIVTASPMAGRNRAEFKQVVGYFANPVVLHSRIADNPTFSDFLAQVRDVVLGAMANQDYPFPLLVDKLAIEREPGSTPITDVVLFLQRPADFDPLGTGLGTRNPTGRLPLGEKGGLLDTGDVVLESFQVEQRISRFDLAILIVETSAGLFAYLQYNSDILNEQTVAGLWSHYESLLRSIASASDARIERLRVLVENERKKKLMATTESGGLGESILRAKRRKAVNLSTLDLIRMSHLETGEPYPLVIEPASDNVDLIEWAGENRAYIEQTLLKHGSLLFRGFAVGSTDLFEKFAQAICPNLFQDYGDLPREQYGGKVYGATPYPHDQPILPHNESSHLPSWPMKIWFYCLESPLSGGETPVIDCRKVYQLLDPEIIADFTKKRLMYVRNFTQGLDLNWQDFFKTEDRAAVEQHCRQINLQCEWKPGDGLRIRNVCPGVARHPKTGEMVFFNQVQAHHISCLLPEVRESLLMLYKQQDLPRNVYYGDGTPIEDSTMAAIKQACQQASASFPWQVGDILMLDNMLMAHSRNPYVGPRKIVVSMGEITSDRSL